jgi:hypothetical protein
MKTEMLRRARKNWFVAGVPTQTSRSNMRKWVKAVRVLGDKWILVSPVRRKDSV